MQEYLIYTKNIFNIALNTKISFPQYNIRQVQLNSPTLSLVLASKIHDNNLCFIINLENNTQIMNTHLKHNILKCLGHPKHKITVLIFSPSSSVYSIHIYNIQTKSKIKAFDLYSQIKYVKWLNDYMLCLITNKHIYKITLTLYEQIQNPCQILCQRMLIEDVYSIMNVQHSSDLQYISIHLAKKGCQDLKKFGTIELFNLQQKSSQMHPGSCATFAHLYIHSDMIKSLIYTYVSVIDEENNYQINFTQLKSIAGHQIFRKAVHFHLTNVDDYPIWSKCSQKYGILVIITRFGHIIIVQLTKFSILYQSQLQINKKRIYKISKNHNNQDIIVFTQEGLCYEIKIMQLILHDFMQKQYSNQEDKQYFMLKYLVRYKRQTITNQLFLQQFKACINNRNYVLAGKLASVTDRKMLRNEFNSKCMKEYHCNHQSIDLVESYYSSLVQYSKLNDVESIQYCKILLIKHKQVEIKKVYNAQKLSISHQLRDLIQSIIQEQKQKENNKQFQQNNRSGQNEDIKQQIQIVKMVHLHYGNKMNQKVQQIPEYLVCPISQQIMEFPVIITTCGHSFDDVSIRDWLRKDQKCPLCKVPCSQANLIKNYSLFSAISSRK